MTKLKNTLRLWIAHRAITGTKFFDVEDKQEKNKTLKLIENLQEWNAK